MISHDACDKFYRNAVVLAVALFSCMLIISACDGKCSANDQKETYGTLEQISFDYRRSKCKVVMVCEDKYIRNDHCEFSVAKIVVCDPPISGMMQTSPIAPNTKQDN